MTEATPDRPSGTPAAGRSILVVGAGVFGLAAALELRRRGWTVRLLDAGEPPHPAASSNDISKAVRMDYGSDALHTELAERAIERWRRWNRRWRETVYHEVGFLLMARRSLAPGSFEGDSVALLRRRGHAPQRIGQRELARRFPAWNAAGYVDGYFNPTAGWTPSARVITLLVREARAAGVELSSRSRVTRLLANGSRVAGVETSAGERIPCRDVLLTTGAWTPGLLPELGPLMAPTAQPVVQFRPADPSPFVPPRFAVWGADIARTGWYGFPAWNGVVKVGNHGPGRRVDADAPRSVEPSQIERFREFLRGTFPGLADAPVAEARLCLYCDTADGDFWIDHDPRREGVAVAAGGSGHGFKFAPVLGEIVADVIERRANRFARRFARREPRGGFREQARSRG